MNDAVDSLIRVIEQRQRFSLQYGTVTFKHSTEIDVKLGGSDVSITNIKYLGSFNPQVNDVVACLVSKNDILAIGVVHK